MLTARDPGDAVVVRVEIGDDEDVAKPRGSRAIFDGRHRPIRTLLLLAGILLLQASGSAASAATAVEPAPDAHLDFTVIRNNAVIGHEQIDRTLRNGSATVSIRAEIVVRFLLVPVYRFEQTSSEVWRQGHLVSLSSDTNDDGTSHTLRVEAKGGVLEVDGDGKRSQAPETIIPASLWNEDIVKQSVVLNTITGAKMSVTVTDRGDETISSRGRQVRAHHYTLSGELQRDLWYDASGTLVQVAFKAKDGSDILYVLR